jgi:hypothetical protein
MSADEILSSTLAVAVHSESVMSITQPTP